jgi:hypothetical protein
MAAWILVLPMQKQRIFLTTNTFAGYVNVDFALRHITAAVSDAE